MSKKKKKIKFIYNDLYDLNIWYFKGWDRKQIKTYLRNKYDFNNFSEVSSIGGSVIMLPVKMKSDGQEAMIYGLYLPNPENVGIVAHEVFHIANRVLRDRGLDLTNESEEAFAYLITWICSQIE